MVCCCLAGNLTTRLRFPVFGGRKPDYLKRKKNTRENHAKTISYYGAGTVIFCDVREGH